MFKHKARSNQCCYSLPYFVESRLKRVKVSKETFVLIPAGTSGGLINEYLLGLLDMLEEECAIGCGEGLRMEGNGVCPACGLGVDRLVLFGTQHSLQVYHCFSFV